MRTYHMVKCGNLMFGPTDWTSGPFNFGRNAAFSVFFTRYGYIYFKLYVKHIIKVVVVGTVKRGMSRITFLVHYTSVEILKHEKKDFGDFKKL